MTTNTPPPDHDRRADPTRRAALHGRRVGARDPALRQHNHCRADRAAGDHQSAGYPGPRHAGHRGPVPAGSASRCRPRRPGQRTLRRSDRAGRAERQGPLRPRGEPLPTRVPGPRSRPRPATAPSSTSHPIPSRTRSTLRPAAAGSKTSGTVMEPPAAGISPKSAT